LGVSIKPNGGLALACFAASVSAGAASGASDFRQPEGHRADIARRREAPSPEPFIRIPPRVGGLYRLVP
jgi:hypothetical protein